MYPYKLSVVVLVYNTEQYIRECMDSLVNQTLKEIEIIVVNDESPDNSALIVEEYLEKYDNITLINQKNSGGAVAGNNGVMQAKGEYVTIMDSDDVVPLDAYEKLYLKAKEKDADIVIGKAVSLVDGKIREVVYPKEREVWSKERSIDNLFDYLDIFYDGFYWNKIYRRSFLIEKDCLMPPGMLYADRPMVHKAFLYADKIEIIPDTVYYWRKRDNTSAQKSITQLKNDLSNLKDRMESLHYQLNYFDEFGNVTLKNEFLKRNVERLFFPINGILESEEFREVYLRETKEVFKLIDNIYDNDLGITKNLYIYMILNDLTEELLFYLSKTPNGKIINENGTYYWALPYFRDENVNIPDELFKIDVLLNQFVSIDKVQLKNNKLIIENVQIPETFTLQEVKVILQSRYNYEDTYEFTHDNSHESANYFSIDISSLQIIDAYDVYLHFKYNDKETKLRMTKAMFSDPKNLSSNSDHLLLYFTINSFVTLINKHIDINRIELGFEKIDVTLDPKRNVDSLELIIRDRKSKETFYFKKMSDNHFELKWKHFLDNNRSYDFFYKVYNKLFRLDVRDVGELKNKAMKLNSTYIRVFETEKGNLSMEALTKKTNNFNSLVKS